MIISILLTAGFSFAFLPSIKFLINFASDDSFFYIKTAYNFSSGNGSTFDLVNPTNGYHPFWFIILSVYFLLLNLFANFDPEFFYRTVVLLQFVISCSTLYFIYKSFKILKSDYSKNFILFCFPFMILVSTRDFGVESPLLCLLFSILLYVKIREIHLDKTFLIYKILLVNFVFLTRTDLIFSVIPALIVVDYFTTNKIERRNLAIVYLLTLVIVLIIYLVINTICFGNAMTISATIKNSFPKFLLYQNFSLLLQPGYLTNQFIKFIFLLLALISFILNFKRKSIASASGKISLFLFSTCLGSLIFLMLNLSFNKQGLREWYVTFPAFVTLLTIFFSFNVIKKNYSQKILLVSICFVTYFYLTRVVNSKWDSTYAYALKLKEVTNFDDKIFQMDMAGITGFFSQRKVINGDGLINSFEYLDYVRNGNLEQYLKDKKIYFYSTHTEEVDSIQNEFTDLMY
ncbi:MAG: hypothetical protein ABIY50_03835, partial [Ignavibacteria bacterium]